MRACIVAVLCVLTGAAAQAAEPARALTGGLALHVAVKGETLRSLAARYGVDPATLAAENGIAADAALLAGQTILLDNRHLVPAAGEAVLVVNVPQRMLFYDAGGTVTGIPVAVGKRDWPTPLRPFTVIGKEVDPTWDVPASIRDEARRAGKELPLRVPPGPANPLGRFWLGLSLPNVGIHGTNAPSSIYRVTTHGCIRVHPDDIAWLFPRVEVGSPGTIIYEPILLAAIGEEVFLEVHRDAYGRMRGDPELLVRQLAARAQVADDEIDWSAVTEVIHAREGVARVVGARKISARERVFSR